ncbi:MAG: hypothetical protein HN356_14810, partial [Calditrichaeota bacterium]|nr:hypothetical protein [Calditrichota bacterium]
MHKTIRLLLISITFVLLFGQMTNAEHLPYYHYVTNIERTVQDEIIWFWTPDTMKGPFHSNDYVGIRWSPRFYGRFSTSQDRYLEYQANPYFEYEPIFNAPPVEFPGRLDNLRRRPFPWVPSQNGRKMTWIKMLGEQGIDIYQYPHGTPRADSLFEHLPVPDDQIIFVDGDVEVEGTLFGTLTIGCSGNMYLLDDCVYDGASRVGGFEEDEMPHMLGLASERNVIIKNTIQNGRNNGGDNWDGPMNRHSIIITAAIVALNESFTFEQQNNDWDRYQGPEPDERGYIFLKGSVAQYRRGYVHHWNHQGTGYGKDYDYDNRFRRDGPPGLGPAEIGVVEGIHDRIELRVRRTYQIRNASIGTFIISPGVELELIGQQPLVVRDSLIMRGTEDLPIRIRTGNPENRTLFRVERGAQSY